MKKFFLSIIFCFVALFTCFAQVEHRISFGVGVFSHAYLSEFFSEFDEVEIIDVADTPELQHDSPELTVDVEEPVHDSKTV